MNILSSLLNFIGSKIASTSYTPEWNDGTDGTAKVARCGNVVTLSIANPTLLPTGSSTVFTLPEGYRPSIVTHLMLITPVGSLPSNANNISLRATIQTNGDVNIYNYRSAALSGNSNASGAVTFIAEG